MKLIFSRKGIDDAYGKGASPIFPNGEMFSIPIPVKAKEKGVLYKDVSFRNHHLQLLVNQLGLPITRKSCHLDPDLNNLLFERHPLWKPCLGHHGAAAKHLLNHNIKAGDVFLFFGSFRKVELGKYKRWSFLSDASKRHILFGYLRIGQILDLKIATDKEKALQLGYQNHPHVLNDYPNTNILFVADSKPKSAGLFDYKDELVLSKLNSSKSIWELPLFFNELSISRHKNRSRYSIENGKTILKTVGIGQDFVVDENKELTSWVNGMIKRHA